MVPLTSADRETEVGSIKVEKTIETVYRKRPSKGLFLLDLSAHYSRKQEPMLFRTVQYESALNMRFKRYKHSPYYRLKEPWGANPHISERSTRCIAGSWMRFVLARNHLIEAPSGPWSRSQSGARLRL